MSLPRMSLHIGDYKKDTGNLRAAGHGGYLMLMMHYWATGTLPDDDKQLASIACMTDKEWKYWCPIIKDLFKGNWKRHKRIDEELATAKAKYEKRAAAGKEGGIAKANRKQNPSNARAKPCQPITLTDIVLTNEERSGESESEAILRKLIEAAAGNVVHNTEGIEVIRPILDLIAMDCSLDLDILPAIAERVPKLPEPLRTWGARWLRDAVLSKQATRLRGRGAAQKQETNWDMWAASWAREAATGDANWPQRLQPNPGENGCRCPPEILLKHGIDPVTGHLIPVKERVA